MFPEKLFSGLSGGDGTKHVSVKSVPAARKFRMFFSTLIACILTFSIFTKAFAAEKPATDTGSAEGLLSSTEQMIEHLILQIDRQKNDHFEKSPAENYEDLPYASCIPNIKPVNGAITSSFGMRMHPILKVMMFHGGTDFGVPEGTQIQTTGDGTVIFTGYDRGYGNKVVVSHGHGFTTVYAHLSKTLVRPKQRVRRGEIIALSGNSGLSTGPHLHYEIHKDNVRVNPVAYFYDGKPNKYITKKSESPKVRNKS